MIVRLIMKSWLYIWVEMFVCLKLFGLSLNENFVKNFTTMCKCLELMCFLQTFISRGAVCHGHVYRFVDTE